MQWRLSFPMQVGAAFAVGFVGLVPMMIDHVGAAGHGEVDVSGASTVRSPLDDVVRIRNRTCGGAELTGTGTVLDDGRVLTAAHVVLRAREITIDSDGTGARVTEVVVSRDDDVAILTPDRPSARPAPGVGRPLAAQDPSVGPALLSVAGHPDGGDERTRIARAEQYLPGRDADDPPTLLRLDAESHPGDSGGPVLDRSGAVVAMVLSRESLTGQALAAPVSILRSGMGAATDQPIPDC